VTFYRSFAWNSRAKAGEPDGPLWFPRALQGDGRHDNPDLYACLYLSEHQLSPVVEQFARFRSQRLVPSMLRRRGLPLALAAIDCAPAPRLVDLDDPAVLVKRNLRPSAVSTRQRSLTQPQGRAIYEEARQLDGIRWWSTYESSWMNVTLFDRAGPKLRLASVRALTVTDPLVAEGAEFLGLNRL
jgi:hypothetical protein